MSDPAFLSLLLAFARATLFCLLRTLSFYEASETPHLAGFLPHLRATLLKSILTPNQLCWILLLCSSSKLLNPPRLSPGPLQSDLIQSYNLNAIRYWSHPEHSVHGFSCVQLWLLFLIYQMDGEAFIYRSSQLISDARVKENRYGPGLFPGGTSLGGIVSFLRCRFFVFLQPPKPAFAFLASLKCASRNIVYKAFCFHLLGG